MSNSIVTIIESSKASFIDKTMKLNTGLEYTVEASFAIQAISKNNFITNIALKNPKSLQNAMINLGAIGLSLNPAESLAYLVPRDDSICLDISYRGLIRLATDSGNISWVQAITVHENDTFEFVGAGDRPIHTMNPFVDRGSMIGVYAIAKTDEGDYMTTTMTMAEIKKIQSTSKGATSKYSPWINYFEEMAKKAVIKRASKTWTMTNQKGSAVLNEAIHVLNEHEGNVFEVITEEHKERYAELVEGDDTLALYCFFQDLEIEQRIELQAQYVRQNAPDRQKGAFTKGIEEKMQEGRDSALQYRDAFFEAVDDVSAQDELREELSDSEYKFIMSLELN